MHRVKSGTGQFVFFTLQRNANALAKGNVIFNKQYPFHFTSSCSLYRIIGLMSGIGQDKFWIRILDLEQGIILPFKGLRA